MIKKSKGKTPTTTKVSFVIPHNPDQETVTVVGDFNEWDPTALKLIKRSNGTRSASVELANDATYRFRYHTADGQWFNDGDADGYTMGDHGAEDCLLIV